MSLKKQATVKVALFVRTTYHEIKAFVSGLLGNKQDLTEQKMKDS